MKKVNRILSISERFKAPTPSFFKKIRRIGLILGGVGAAILAAPITFPAIITVIAGYLATAGLVASAVASGAVDEPALKAK